MLHYCVSLDFAIFSAHPFEFSVSLAVTSSNLALTHFLVYCVWFTTGQGLVVASVIWSNFLKIAMHPFLLLLLFCQKKIYFFSTNIDSVNPHLDMEIKMESWLLLFLFFTLCVWFWWNVALYPFLQCLVSFESLSWIGCFLHSQDFYMQCRASIPSIRFVHFLFIQWVCVCSLCSVLLFENDFSSLYWLLRKVYFLEGVIEVVDWDHSVIMWQLMGLFQKTWLNYNLIWPWNLDPTSIELKSDLFFDLSNSGDWMCWMKLG